jgi:hypothetical protein
VLFWRVWKVLRIILAAKYEDRLCAKFTMAKKNEVNRKTKEKYEQKNVPKESLVVQGASPCTHDTKVFNYNTAQKTASLAET